MQGLFLFWAGIKDKISYRFKQNIYSVTGLVFVAYAAVIYPVIGLLLLTDKRVPKYLLLIPLIWSLIGFNAAIALGIREWESGTLLGN